MREEEKRGEREVESGRKCGVGGECVYASVCEVLKRKVEEKRRWRGKWKKRQSG